MPVEQFPFIKGELTEADFGETSRPAFDMWEMADREDIIIREESERINIYQGEFKEGLNKRINVYKTGRKLFKELEDKYNINIISFNYVIGKADPNDSPQIFTITEKVFGKNLGDMNQQSINFQEIKKLSLEADQLISSLAEYAKDKHKSGEVMLNDIFLHHQYVFGKRANDTEKKLYLVDVEPLIIDLKKITFDLRDNQILHELGRLQYFITHIELLTHIKLMDSRKKLNNLFEHAQHSCRKWNFGEIENSRISWEKITKYNEESGLYRQ